MKFCWAILLLLVSSQLSATVILKKIEQGNIGCAKLEIKSPTTSQNQTVTRCWDISPYFAGKNAGPIQIGPTVNRPWSIEKLNSDKFLSPVPWFGDEVIDLAISQQSLCAILKNKTVACVGDGYTTYYGSYPSPELKPNDFHSLSETPIPVPLGSEVPLMIASTASKTYCVATQSNRVHCWEASNIAPIIIDKWQSTPRHAVSRKTLEGFSKDYYGEPHTISYDLGSPIKQLSVHAYRFCALLENGDVKCHSPHNFNGLWGSKEKSELENIADQFINGENKVSQTQHKRIKYNLSSPFYSLKKKDLEAVNVHIGSGHTCITYKDGTADCWGVIATSDKLPEIPKKSDWYTFEFLSWYSLLDLKKRIHFKTYPYRFYEAKSKTQKVDAILSDGTFNNHFPSNTEGNCFRLIPGAPDGSSNLKCTTYQAENKPLNDEFWLDDLPWVPISLPIATITPGKTEHFQSSGCITFVNGAAKCGSTLQEIVDRPELPYIQFTLNSISNGT